MEERVSLDVESDIEKYEDVGVEENKVTFEFHFMILIFKELTMRMASVKVYFCLCSLKDKEAPFAGCSPI